jgi:hypothetical protein
VRGTAACLAALAGLVLPGASASAEPVPPPPPTSVDLVASVRLTPTAARSCPGARDACTIESADGMSLELRLTPTEFAANVRVELVAARRAPGERRFEDRVTRRVTLQARDPAASLPLRELVRRSGTWCVRVTLVDAPQLAAAAHPPTCIRLRPPIELGWVGDVVVGSGYGLPPNGGRDQFAAVARLLRGPDLMIGNYEGPLSRGGSPRCGGGGLCYLFQAPPGRARNLRDAGFDVMNLANNHALDFGADSRRQTVRALRAVGIESAGMPGRVTFVRVEDTLVGIVGLSPYPGTSSLRDPRQIRALVRRARRSADVVVVCVHVGLEGPAGAHVPRGADYGTLTRRATHLAIDSGADVVFGSGPHVVRGIERRRGRYIVYSSGNFAGWRNFGSHGLTAQSGVVRMTFDHLGRPRAAAWDPVVLDGRAVPRPDRSGEVLRRVAGLSRADFGSRGAHMRRDGRFY